MDSCTNQNINRKSVFDIKIIAVIGIVLAAVIIAGVVLTSSSSSRENQV